VLQDTSRGAGYAAPGPGEMPPSRTLDARAEHAGAAVALGSRTQSRSVEERLRLHVVVAAENQAAAVGHGSLIPVSTCQVSVARPSCSR